MRKIAFATDLDGTLISTDNAPDGHKTMVVASINGNKIYMTKDNITMLKELSNIADIIPVTTRCLKSYNKIGLCVPIKNALIENGAILISNNKQDLTWKYSNAEKIEEDRDLVDKCVEYLVGAGYRRKSDAEFVIDYIRDEHNIETNTAHVELLNNLAGDKFDIVKNGDNGIYATTKSLSKDNMLKKFLKMNQYETIICAGDTNGDWGMLSTYENSIGLDNGPAAYRYPKDKYDENQHLFAEFVLKTALEIAKKCC